MHRNAFFRHHFNTPSDTLILKVQLFKTRHFARWMRSTEITDAILRKAMLEMTRGLIDADLGGGLVKKRIGLPGRGKRGGVRALVATRQGDRWIYLFGFQKNERDNIDAAELDAFRTLANDLTRLDDRQMDELRTRGALVEIFSEQPDR
ncbi:type II toxin-antitoxin system RelE/ParE family toxin [Zeimonas arvi]|uniref:Type II toxin-antitoxin system RelE/ParE family toxin n=1 Tax=Zeimonas arvi TaxID=2498847 RepID=A0A5C8NXG9_9BURK|nr:type II toxin-antitoxin system RelE/ParE family toxin [Zeimonas arvi]TXL65987.1 type II toxin-antitoxin system RelE/ParE family toxin [Zeimonas arvi]